MPSSAALHPAQHADALCLHQLMVARGDLMLCGPLAAEIQAGQIWQLAGPNGTGKTTLLMMLAGILPCDPAQLSWRGQPPIGWSALYIGHAAGLNSSLTVWENLQFLCGLYAQSVSADQLLSAIERVGLAGYEEVVVARLSSGQKRRVQLARLWLPESPELWLLDEPLTALDVRMVAALNTRLQQHAVQGGRVVLTSHQPVVAVTHQLDLDAARMMSLEE
ncbi:MAG: heme ABC exporter ATP-binding protein CcmA [Pseudomonadota bacterium]|nr:heme ABC exporter ATP-binding protein CcmA [Pseudomonadota bacterium]